MNTTETKIRPDDILGNLPAEDQQRIRAWLQCHSFRKVQKLLAQPRPEGLDLLVNYSTVSRYHARTRAAGTVAASKLDAGQLLDLMHEKAHAEILDPDASLSDQAALARLILRLASLQQHDRRAAQQDRALELRRESRHLASQRHDLELLKTLRDHFPLISKINWETETQDAQSLERLKRLFGLTTLNP